VDYSCFGCLRGIPQRTHCDPRRQNDRGYRQRGPSAAPATRVCRVAEYVMACGLAHRIPFSTSAPTRSSTPAITSISRSRLLQNPHGVRSFAHFPGSNADSGISSAPRCGMLNCRETTTHRGAADDVPTCDAIIVLAAISSRSFPRVARGGRAADREAGAVRDGPRGLLLFRVLAGHPAAHPL
jgi:hypothetical protein